MQFASQTTCTNECHFPLSITTKAIGTMDRYRACVSSISRYCGHFRNYMHYTVCRNSSVAKMNLLVFHESKRRTSLDIYI
jgi:hypothetical protein